MCFCGPHKSCDGPPASLWDEQRDSGGLKDAAAVPDKSSAQDTKADQATLALTSHVNREGVFLTTAAVEDLLAYGAQLCWDLAQESAGGCAGADGQTMVGEGQLLADLDNSRGMTQTMASTVVHDMQGFGNSRCHASMVLDRKLIVLQIEPISQQNPIRDLTAGAGSSRPGDIEVASKLEQLLWGRPDAYALLVFDSNPASQPALHDFEQSQKFA